METLALYLVKSAALMALFLGAYHLLLKRETFFKSNRWYLLLGLVTSLLLPLVTFKRVVWVEAAAPITPVVPLELAQVSDSGLSEMDAAGFAMAATPEPSFEVDWMLVAIVIYGLVALALTVQFMRDFFALRRLLKGKTVQRRSGYKFVDVPENVAPFSYFSYIVYNSSMFSHDELINILEHEKVHSIQRHTLDVLISRIICIAFWWNPVVWFYKKAIVQNLEFIADSEAAKKIPDIKAYQFTLLKITTHESCVSITNHFFQSLIKKRIVMLNKNQSSKWNSCKYLLIVPALAAFMLYFQVKVVAQEKHSDVFFIKGAQEGVEVVVDKNTSDAELKQHAEDLKKNHGIKLKFSKVKRNSAGEIVCIKAEFKDQNGKKGTTMISGDKPIEPIRFFKNDNTIGFGNSSDHVRLAKNFRISRNGNDDRNHNFSFAFNEPDVDVDTDVVVVGEPFEFEEDSSGEHKVVVKSFKKGKQKVIVNGKVVAEADIDTENGLDELDPIEIRTIKNGPHGSTVIVNGEKVFDMTSDEISELTDKAMEEAKIAMERSRADMKRSRIAMKRSAADMRRSQIEMRRAHEEDDSEVEMEEARKEIEAARAEIKKAKAEIEKMRADMKKEQRAKAKK
ncbi:peptidase M56 [Flavobacterium sp. MAH-1]|uniref:Peptidase M56 n=1 Tax=Flavobacterium agri TaxID=2743471 RepID=A0A7Y9C4C9_9FLAO|nr:M56 family metallopeptidase [Flavobacterium agri]NUY79755.1 peptidase M56 [Flavobacterium agri]NYA69780.1 peptidase M56 [Flavobacterium agri]